MQYLNDKLKAKSEKLFIQVVQIVQVVQSIKNTCNLTFAVQVINDK